MSDLARLGRRLALTAGLLAAALPVAAQQRSTDPAAVRARVDSLRLALEDARADLDSATRASRRRRIASGAAALDTQRVGPVTVVSRRSDAPVARVEVERALRRLGPVGARSGSVLDDFTLLVEDGGNVALFDEMTSDDAAIVWLPPYTLESRRTGAVLRALEARLTTALPADVRAWLGGSVAFRADDDRLAAVYRSLITTPSVAAERCRAGGLDACAAALGLTDPGPAWQAWYTRAQLEAWLAAGHWSTRTTEQLRQYFDACFELRSEVACDSAAAHGHAPPPPLAVQARISLIAYALERGGADAYARLTSDTTGDLLTRLARASEVAPDSLLSGWRARVMEARPALSAGIGGSVLLTLFWAIALSALATRSKRWRLG